MTNYITEEEEDQLYNNMKSLPDFRNFPLPTRWFKKYGIPPIEAGTTKEYLESGYTTKIMFAPKDLPPIILKEPQRDVSGNVKFVKFVEEEPIEIKVISRPYDPDAQPLDISTISQSSDTSVAPLEPEVQEPEQTRSSCDESSSSSEHL
jgi:hypothetical protein